MGGFEVPSSRLSELEETRKAEEGHAEAERAV